MDPDAQTDAKLAAEVDALIAAVMRFGVSIREEAVPGGSPGDICRIGKSRVLFLAPDAPPWARRQALVRALRRLPTDDVFLPPIVRAALGSA